MVFKILNGLVLWYLRISFYKFLWKSLFKHTSNIFFIKIVDFSLYTTNLKQWKNRGNVKFICSFLNRFLGHGGFTLKIIALNPRRWGWKQREQESPLMNKKEEAIPWDLPFNYTITQNRCVLLQNLLQYLNINRTYIRREKVP